MQYVRLASRFDRCPRFDDFTSILRVSRETAAGILTMAWAWLGRADYLGDPLNLDRLAECWDRKTRHCKRIIPALQQSGYLEPHPAGGWRWHDWVEHQSIAQLQRQRARDAERKAAEREEARAFEAAKSASSASRLQVDCKSSASRVQVENTTTRENIKESGSRPVGRPSPTETVTLEEIHSTTPAVSERDSASATAVRPEPKKICPERHSAQAPDGPVATAPAGEHHQAELPRVGACGVTAHARESTPSPCPIDAHAEADAQRRADAEARARAALPPDDLAALETARRRTAELRAAAARAPAPSSVGSVLSGIITTAPQAMRAPPVTVRVTPPPAAQDDDPFAADDEPPPHDDAQLFDAPDPDALARWLTDGDDSGGAWAPPDDDPPPNPGSRPGSGAPPATSSGSRPGPSVKDSAMTATATGAPLAARSGPDPSTDPSAPTSAPPDPAGARMRGMSAPLAPALRQLDVAEADLAAVDALPTPPARPPPDDGPDRCYNLETNDESRNIHSPSPPSAPSAQPAAPVAPRAPPPTGSIADVAALEAALAARGVTDLGLLRVERLAELEAMAPWVSAELDHACRGLPSDARWGIVVWRLADARRKGVGAAKPAPAAHPASQYVDAAAQMAAWERERSSDVMSMFGLAIVELSAERGNSDALVADLQRHLELAAALDNDRPRQNELIAVCWPQIPEYVRTVVQSNMGAGPCESMRIALGGLAG